MKEGLALNSGFTIRRFRSYLASDNLVFFDYHNRICEGMLLAGAPEG
jgi:hypothetical protein